MQRRIVALEKDKDLFDALLALMIRAPKPKPMHVVSLASTSKDLDVVPMAVDRVLKKS